MRSVINKFGVWPFLSFLLTSFYLPAFAADSFDGILKDAAIRNGLKSPEDLSGIVDRSLVEVGEGFFSSTNLANSRDISCQDCHLDEFSSADGLPIAIGINGRGIGSDRAMSEGEIIPRNTLPLWGRGHKGFDTFFWDGRVELVSAGSIKSQFGASAPSLDPLTVAVHLPLVEIKEMLVETKEVKDNKLESVDAAANVFDYILSNLKEWEPLLIQQLADAKGITIEELTFIDVADSLASFIRSKFAIRNTQFHDFVFGNEDLTEDQKSGATLFYGKAKCSVCHAGAYFTDFQYHTIAFPQLGSGRNGFGIDYGRFNVTHNPADLYKFRTPPLFNVTNTPPYGHSGSVNSLEEVVRFHFDPLSDTDHVSAMGDLERTEYYKVLTSANEALLLIPFLTSEEVGNIVSFLETLSF